MTVRGRIIVFLVCAAFVGTAGYYLICEIWQDVKLTVYDQLARPGEKAELIAKLEQKGPLGFNQDMKGCPVRFWSAMFKVTEGRTGANGIARVRVEFPSDAYGPGNFNAEFPGADYRKPANAPGRVFLWSREARILVLDIDHTLYGLDLNTTVRSQADDHPALAEAAQVLTELNQTYYIVYLTHCEDGQFHDTQAWLKEKGFPDGPCFCRSFYPAQTQEGFKLQFVTDLARRFPKTQIGVGDRPSDAKAYLANGLRAFILDPEKNKSDLPDEAVRVASWKEVGERLRK